MEPVNAQLVWELTPKGWQYVERLRGQAEPLQQAAGYNVVVRIAADVSPVQTVPSQEVPAPSPKPKFDPGQSFFFGPKGERQRQSAESILLKIAEFQDRGISPTQVEIAKSLVPPISPEAVNEHLEKLRTAGLVVSLEKKQRANVISPTGRKWLWKLRQNIDIASVVSRLVDDGKITTDELKAAKVTANPEDKQAVMEMLGMGETSV